MNKNRKRFGFLLTAALFSIQALMPNASQAAHWAQAEMDYLFDKGVISGDDNGLRPDDLITRSEFAKIANKDFGFTEKAVENFSDVAFDAWYAEDMAIARHSGYFSGDQNGMGNPEEKITRAEVCVSYAKILGLKTEEDAALSYTDNEQIPKWAVAYIAALSKANILNGYEDGSFRAINYITRAEVFSTIVRTENYAKQKKQEELESGEKQPGGNNSGGVIIGGSSGGGGGGGSSSGNTSSVLAKPVIISVNPAEGSVTWEAVKNAAGYEMVITRTTEGKPGEKSLIGLTGTKANITSVLEELIKTDKTALETFTIKVRAVNGTTSSAYSKTEDFHLTFHSVRIPDDILCAEKEDGTFYLTWSAAENAKGYEVFHLSESGEAPLAVEGTTVNLTPEMASSDSIKIKFRTLSNSEEILDSAYLEKDVPVPMFYGGRGITGDEYLIRTERHFWNIQKEPAMCYQIIDDIELTNFSPIPNFSGSLEGAKNYVKDAPVKLTIYFNDINKTDMALFAVTVNAVIKNLALAGEMTAGSKSAGLISNATGGVVENVINEVSMNFAGGQWCGGLIGTAKDTKITACGNLADIQTSATNTGGIVGYLNTGAIAENCYNIGDITAKANFVGGIAGAGYGSINGAFNSGNISNTADSAGGIAGYLRQPEGGVLKYAFNTGTIQANNNAAGITCNINPSGSTMIDEVYNTGNVTTTKAGTAAYVYQLKQVPAKTTIGEHVYYLDGIKGGIGFDGETKPKKVLELREIQFPSGRWETKGSYPYPQLKTMEYQVKGGFQPAVPQTPAAEISRQGQKIIMKVTGQAEIFQYAIEIWKDSLKQTEFSLAGGIVQTIDITDKLGEYGEYEIRATAYGDGIHFSVSQQHSFTYTHKALEKQPLTNMSVEWGQTSENKEKYIISWDSFEDAASYQVKVSDKNGTEVANANVTGVSYEIIESDTIVFNDEFTVSVTALDSSSSGLSLDTLMTLKTLYAGGTGTDEDSYLIANERHFNNISQNTSASYRLVKDITLSAMQPIASFSGKLIGALDGTEGQIAKITYQFSNAATKKAGLFTTITNGLIKNIRLAGSLNAGSDSAPLASMIIGSEINNCHNEMEVTVTGTSSTKAGGIISSATLSSSIKNCSNTGSMEKLKSMMSGGIVGHVDTTSKVEDCYNTANITSTVNNIGGIVGAAYGSVVRCYNSGNVTAGSDNAGGIIGFISVVINGAASYKYLFNTGTVTSPKAAGGITASISAKSGATVDVDEVYNIGNVISANKTGGAIYSADVNANTQFGSYVFYLEGITADRAANSTLVTAAQLSDKSNPVFPSGEWEYRDGYAYPQLKN